MEPSRLPAAGALEAYYARPLVSGATLRPLSTASSMAAHARCGTRLVGRTLDEVDVTSEIQFSGRGSERGRLRPTGAASGKPAASLGGLRSKRQVAVARRLFVRCSVVCRALPQSPTLTCAAGSTTDRSHDCLNQRLPAPWMYSRASATTLSTSTRSALGTMPGFTSSRVQTTSSAAARNSCATH